MHKELVKISASVYNPMLEIITPSLTTPLTQTYMALALTCTLIIPNPNPKKSVS